MSSEFYNVAWFDPGGAHPHDYGCDFIFDGMRQLEEEGAMVMGRKLRVMEWIPKPTRHLPSVAERDECQCDADLFWPTQNLLLSPDEIDLVIIEGSPMRWHLGKGRAQMARSAMAHLKAEARVVALDMSDDLALTYRDIETLLECGIDVVFKRERQIGRPTSAGFTRTRVEPCPLTYPTSRAVGVMDTKRQNKVFYYATVHGYRGPGIPRLAIAQGLRERLSPEQLDILLTPSQECRPTPEEYRRRKSQATVGIHWNGAENWDGNRFWSNFALGLAQVAERPRIDIPMPFINGEHVVYVDSIEAAVWAAVDLIRDPERARRIAIAGQQHWRMYHSSTARAEYVLRLSQP